MGEVDHLFSKLRESLKRVCTSAEIGNSNTVIIQIPWLSPLNHINVVHKEVLYMETKTETVAG